MSYFFNFFFEKKDKEIKNGQRILHFSVNDNPTENYQNQSFLYDLPQ